MSHQDQSVTSKVASTDEIHRSVRDRYATIAQSGTVGCCEDVLKLAESAAEEGEGGGATLATAVAEAVIKSEAADCCGPECCADPSSAAEVPAAEVLVDRLQSVLSNVEENACCDDDCCSPSGDMVVQGPSTEASEAHILGLGCGDPLFGAEIQPGDRVVDLGSGAGGDVLRAARQCGPEGEVVGIDMTPEMLERARSNADSAGASNVRFEEGLIEAMPLPDESADWIISNCVINLAPDKAPVFAEIARVLKPGGRMSVADVVRPEGAKTSMPAPGERWASCIDGAIAVDAFREGLEQAGLVEVEIEPIGKVHKAIEVSRTGLPFSARIRALKPASASS